MAVVLACQGAGMTGDIKSITPGHLVFLHVLSQVSTCMSSTTNLLDRDAFIFCLILPEAI